MFLGGVIPHPHRASTHGYTRDMTLTRTRSMVGGRVSSGTQEAALKIATCPKRRTTESTPDSRPACSYNAWQVSCCH